MLFIKILNKWITQIFAMSFQKKILQEFIIWNWDNKWMQSLLVEGTVIYIKQMLIELYSVITSTCLLVLVIFSAFWPHQNYNNLIYPLHLIHNITKHQYVWLIMYNLNMIIIYFTPPSWLNHDLLCIEIFLSVWNAVPHMNVSLN